MVKSKLKLAVFIEGIDKYKNTLELVNRLDKHSVEVDVYSLKVFNSKYSFNLMKNILLKGEYSQSELSSISENIEEINYEKKKNLRTEVFDKLDKSKETFINK